MTRAFTLLVAALMGVFLSKGLTAAHPCAPPTAECCTHPDVADQHGIIWTGHEAKMPIERLAAYAAPALWLSPGEPLLEIGQTGGRTRWTLGGVAAETLTQGSRDHARETNGDDD